MPSRCTRGVDLGEEDDGKATHSISSSDTLAVIATPPALLEAAADEVRELAMVCLRAASNADLYTTQPAPAAYRKPYNLADPIHRSGRQGTSFQCLDTIPSRSVP